MVQTVHFTLYLRAQTAAPHIAIAQSHFVGFWATCGPAAVSVNARSLSKTQNPTKCDCAKPHVVQDVVQPKTQKKNLTSRRKNATFFGPLSGLCVIYKHRGHGAKGEKKMKKFAVYSNKEAGRFVIRYLYKRSADKKPVFGFSLYYSEAEVRKAARGFSKRGYVVAENGIERQK